jgi:hypothetical protein
MCAATVRKGYISAGQYSPFAYQRELTLHLQHDPPTHVSGSSPMPARRHNTISRWRIRTETDEEDLRI